MEPGDSSDKPQRTDKVEDGKAKEEALDCIYHETQRDSVNLILDKDPMPSHKKLIWQKDES